VDHRNDQVVGHEIAAIHVLRCAAPEIGARVARLAEQVAPGQRREPKLVAKALCLGSFAAARRPSNTMVDSIRGSSRRRRVDQHHRAGTSPTPWRTHKPAASNHLRRVLARPFECESNSSSRCCPAGSRGVHVRRWASNTAFAAAATPALAVSGPDLAKAPPASRESSSVVVEQSPALQGSRARAMPMRGLGVGI
jgi:hypothetical protein